MCVCVCVSARAHHSATPTGMRSAREPMCTKAKPVKRKQRVAQVGWPSCRSIRFQHSLSALCRSKECAFTTEYRCVTQKRQSDRVRPTGRTGAGEGCTEPPISGSTTSIAWPTLKLAQLCWKFGATCTTDASALSCSRCEAIREPLTINAQVPCATRVTSTSGRVRANASPLPLTPHAPNLIAVAFDVRTTGGWTDSPPRAVALRPQLWRAALLRSEWCMCCHRSVLCCASQCVALRIELYTRCAAR